jgi:hypothetical protein
MLWLQARQSTLYNKESFSHLFMTSDTRKHKTGKSWPLSSWFYSGLCQGLFSEHASLLLDMEVQCLSCGKVLACGFQLCNEMQMFSAM